MKKSIKVQTIIWAILLFISIVVIGFSIVMVKNAQTIFEARDYVEIDLKIINEAKIGMAYGVGLIFFAIIIIFIGGYVTYAGIKSWRYEVVDED